ncbi:hypothetical protein BJY52DRAFT_1187583 [Lactarius psammicola]|nr:hypothetical protein BJY52DRAFT_1187583 [Lactarius psammicola]
MSFLSVEPQSRAVLESHSSSLLAQFDTLLQIIADRYLAFFQERRSIEATYIDSLRKLHRKAKTVDASFDPRAEPTTTRAAWDEVRDNLEKEASAQQAFVDILDNDVIKPLTTLKESNNETRKRIEEDLKRSTAKYADHVESTISKLQQAYLKKYHPQQYAHSTEVLQRPQNVLNKGFGGRVSSLFRGRREDLSEPEPPKLDRPDKPAKSEEGIVNITHGLQLGILNLPFELVSDDECRRAVCQLNIFRSGRAECLVDGYIRLGELVFTTTVRDVLIKYMDGMMSVPSSRREIFDNLTWLAEQRAQDSFDLKASFRLALSFSIPPLTLYRNNRPGAYSDLIFGLPLVDLATDQDGVPKNIFGDAEVLQLRRRFESEKSFSFSSTDNIHSVAMLLERYLWDLPEPLLVLSLQDYRNYRQNRARFTENEFSLLRSKTLELHPAHRASLGALLRHLLRVASHSNKNAMTVGALAAQFGYAVLLFPQLIPPETLVMEDLIQHAHTLFDERPPPSPPVPLPNVVDTTSTYTYGSLFLSPEFPQPADVQTIGPTTHHRPWHVGGIPISTHSSFSPLPLDAAMESRLTPSPTPLLSPLLGLPSSQTLTEGVEATTQEQGIPEARGTKAVESTLATSIPDWLRQSRLPSHSEPQSPPESVLSSNLDFPLSSATSLQTRMGRFSP